MKMRKLISLVLALVMVFGLAAPVMAAEESVQETAGGRLLSLGVIEGYTDGTLGLDKTITRAEIAVVLARISGMGDAADLLKDTPSKFSDVKTGEWYTGWINLASSQGWVVGDPQGTFRPNDSISYREIVTVLLKVLGYDDNLPGDWPTNFLAKAAALGITKGIVSDAKAPAVRGDVFVMTSRTLDEEVVKFDKDTGKFDGTGESLLVAKMDLEKAEGVVTDIPRVTSSLKDNQIRINGTTYKVVGNVDYEAIFGCDVNAWLNDDGDVVFIDIESDEVLYDALKDVTKDELTLVDADDEYDIDEDVLFYVNGKKLSSSDIKKLDKEEYDYAKVVLNEDGDVAFVDAYNWDEALVVEKVDGEYILGYGDEIDAEDYVIVKDGKTIALADLKKGDILFYNSNAEYAEVFNKSVEGEIERIYEDSIRVAGKDYKVDGVKYIDEDGDIASFVKASNTYKNVVEAMQDAGKVAVFLNRAGDMVFLSGDVSDIATSSNYAFVHYATQGTPYQIRGENYFALDVVNAEGKLVKYDINAKDVEANDPDGILFEEGNSKSIAWDASKLEGKVVEISLDKSGDIDEILILTEKIADDIKTSASYVAGNKINSDATVFLNEDYVSNNKKDAKDVDVDVWNKLDFDKIVEGKAYVKDSKVVAFVVDKSDRGTGDKHLTVATSDVKKVSGKDIYTLSLVINGEKVKVDTEDSAAKYIEKGDLLEVQFDKKNVNINKLTKIANVNDSSLSGQAVRGEISAIRTSNSSFEIDKAPYRLGAKSVIVDATDSYKVLNSLSNLKNGDAVVGLKVKDSNTYIEVLVKVDKDLLNDEDKDLKEGTVTYIGGTVLEVTLPEGANPADYAVVIGENARGIVDGKADFAGVLENGKIYTAKLVKVAELDKAISTVTFVANIETAPVTERTIEDAKITSISATAIKVKGETTTFKFNDETEFDVDGTVTIGSFDANVVKVGEYVTLVVKGDQVISLALDTVHSGELKAIEALETAKAQLAQAIADAEELLAQEQARVAAISADDQTALEAAYTIYAAAVADTGTFATAINTAKAFDVTGKTAAQINTARTTLETAKTTFETAKTAFDTAVSTLETARTKLAQAIADAEALYNTEKARLDSFTASEIAAINSAEGDGYDTYAAALVTFKGAINTAKAFDVTGKTATQIDTARTTLETAKTTFETAKSTFDALPTVVSIGK